MKTLKTLLLSSALSLALIFAASAQVNIPMWQADVKHTGLNPNETILTPAKLSTAGAFGLLFTQPVDGQTYGQVLYASNITLPDTSVHNLVFVGTEHDSLYAFDADNNTGSNASPIWHAAMVPTGSVPVPQADVGSGDILIELGLTETPVIDTSTNTIYIVSKVKTTDPTRTDSTGTYLSGTYQQYLHALDLATGTEKFNGPVLVNTTFAGTSNIGGNEATAVGVNNQTGSAYPPNTVPFNALHEHMRAAMTLYNGIVYLSYASHSDTNPYHGEIIGYNASNLQVARTFIATPNGEKAGIWGGGASPVIDPATGNMFVTFGNGAFDQANSSFGTDWGESFVKLSTSTPALGAFTANFSDPNTFFTPYNWNALNGGDVDLGSSGILVLPDQTGPHPHIMVSGGKGGVLYVVDRDSLGGLGNTAAATNPDVQEIVEPGGNSLFVTPAYFNGNIYYSAAGSPLEQRTVGYNATTGTYIGTNPILSTSNFNVKGSGVFISSNGNTNGIVWILNGNLRAYDATNVAAPPLFTENATVPPNLGCQTTKFSLPSVAGGKVYYTAYDNTNTGHLFVSGIIPPPVGSPSDPSNLTAAAISLSQVSLNWTDNSNNESGFIIKRASSAGGGTFTQVGTTTANVTTFVDSGLNPATTYFYQAIATNANGSSFASNTASATTFPIFALNGLVAYWNLDDGISGVSSAQAADSTGNGHTGLVIGETGFDITGKVNGSVEFHGTGNAPSHIAVASSPSLQFSAYQSFTLSAWVLPADFKGVEQAVVVKSADQGNEFGIFINANDQWVGRGNGGDIVGTTAASNVWSHVALVQDGAAGTRKLYVNGVLVGTGIAQAANGAGDLWLGQQNAAALESFPGSLDEVRVYNIALSATDVANLLSPPLLQAISIQTQGTSGTFGLVIAPISTKVLETRKGTTPGQYTLTVSFAAPVSGISASLGLQGGGTAVGSIQSLTYDGTGKVVTIVLTGVADTQALNLHLSGILPGNGASDIPFNVLWGDVNGDSAVNAVDVNTVTHSHAASVNSTTAFYDLNGDGKIDASDDAIATAANGTHLGTETDTNLALYGTPTASSVNGGNVAANAFDTDTTVSRWESAQAPTTPTTTPYPQSLSVDLGQVSTIHSIILNWEPAGGATYNLNVSNDNVNWTTVIAVGTGTPGALLTLPANTTAGIHTYSGFTTTGRYVQMAGVTRLLQYGYSLYDFEVIGVPGLITFGNGPIPVINSILSTTARQAEPFSYQITATNNPTGFAAFNLPAGLSLNPTTGLISGTPFTSGTTSNIAITASNANGPSTTATLTINVVANGDTNLALNKTATASSVNAGNLASFATDNNLGSRWESVQMVDPQSITVDLGQIDTIHSVILNWETAAGANYTVDVSADGTNWLTAVSVVGNATSGVHTYGGLGATARYIRMSGMTRDSNFGYSLYDFEALGITGPVNGPTFASQTASQAVAAGQPVTFTANAGGTGPFTYQWLKNGTNISGATGSTYTVGSVSASDYGTYLVVITNAYGSITSSFFTLSAPAAPTPSTDTPTMPLWALFVLGLLLLGMGQRFLPQTTPRKV